MDGYGFNSLDLIGKTSLPVAGIMAAGDNPNNVFCAATAFVFTPARPFRMALIQSLRKKIAASLAIPLF